MMELPGPDGELAALRPHVRLVEAMLRCTDLAALRPAEMVAAIEGGIESPYSREVAGIVAEAAEIAQRCLAEGNGSIDAPLQQAAVAIATWWVATIVGAVMNCPAPMIAGASQGLDAMLADAVAEALEAVVVSVGRHHGNGAGRTA